jgi:hypothetical protein
MDSISILHGAVILHTHYIPNFCNGAVIKLPNDPTCWHPPMYIITPVAIKCFIDDQEYTLDQGEHYIPPLFSNHTFTIQPSEDHNVELYYGMPDDTYCKAYSIIQHYPILLDTLT